MKFRVCLAILATVWAASAPGQDYARDRGRLSPYVADFKIVNEISLSSGITIRGKNGRFTRMPDQWSDDGGLLLGQPLENTKRELAALGNKCGLAGGRFGAFGFQSVSVRYVLYLRRDSSKTRRILVRGTTAYEGTEDSEPGTFFCMIDEDAVKIWLFEPR